MWPDFSFNLRLIFQTFQYFWLIIFFQKVTLYLWTFELSNLFLANITRLLHCVTKKLEGYIHYTYKVLRIKIWRENEIGKIRKCTEICHRSVYTYNLTLWMFQGPCTCFAAMFSVVGTCFAIRFLRNARLNKTMSAGMFFMKNCFRKLDLFFFQPFTHYV